VLLTGDLYHFTEQVANRGVPPFNHDRADTLASMDRFDRIAKNLKAKVIIQHEPADIAKLPAFPAGGAMKALLSTRARRTGDAGADRASGSGPGRASCWSG
jgi:hypothetical protein